MAVNNQPRWVEIWVREEEGQKMTSKTGQIQWKGTQIWPQVTPSKTSACRQRMSVKKMTNKKNDVHGTVKNSECSWFKCTDMNPTLKLEIIRNTWRKSKDAFWNSRHNVYVRGQDLRGRAERGGKGVEREEEAAGDTREVNGEEEEADSDILGWRESCEGVTVLTSLPEAVAVGPTTR